MPLFSLSKNEFYRITALGLTLLLPKLPLFLAPYFLSTNNLFEFNRFYYSASLILLFTTFGFDFAFNIVKPKIAIIFISLLSNAIITMLIFTLIQLSDFSAIMIFSLFVYALLMSYQQVFSFRLLFTGHYLIYFFIHLLVALLLLSVVLLLGSTHKNDLLIYFPAYALIALLITLWLFYKNESESFLESRVKPIYQCAASAFLINSIIPLLFTIDKYIASNTFDVITANSYTFSWTITAPLFYIGNLIEKMIYSSKNENNRSLIIKSLAINLGLIIIYILIILSLLILYPVLLPKTVDEGLVKSISFIMLIGYSLYTLIHFPVNGYLFKYGNPKMQKMIAKKYFVASILFVSVLALLYNLVGISYITLLIFNLLILTIVTLIKLNEIWGLKNLKAKYENK